MKSIYFILFILFPLSSIAAETDNETIQTCLKKWGAHPFSGKETAFRTLEGGFQIFGSGPHIDDSKVTETPDLVLVKRNITAISSKKIRLGNPKGWYCMEGAVTVIGSTKIDLACGAKLASAIEGTTIIGSTKTPGVINVIGSTDLNQTACQ